MKTLSAQTEARWLDLMSKLEAGCLKVERDQGISIDVWYTVRYARFYIDLIRDELLDIPDDGAEAQTKELTNA